MIFYFTGTGNSKHVAERIGELIGDSKIKFIADYYDDIMGGKGVSVDVDSNETLVFVSPVHSWGLAKSMRRFLKKVKINYSGSKVYGILVCGAGAVAGGVMET